MIRRNNNRRMARPVKTGPCPFCTTKTEPDYKEVEALSKLVSERGKIQPRSRNGLCQHHQRRATKAIKRARFLALMPFTATLKQI